jgi:NAD(P)-dependent dehydrogenase (short-subunit alcohol dehydrogenase family)
VPPFVTLYVYDTHMQVQMIVAVLGGTGRAGQPLVAELLRRDHKVVVLARDPAKLGTIRGQEWAASDLDWTLVRAPRLRDGPPTHAVEHDAHRSAPSPFLRRSDLAEFLVDVLEQGLYIRQAPLVGAKSAPDDPVPE